MKRAVAVLSVILLLVLFSSCADNSDVSQTTSFTAGSETKASSSESTSTTKTAQDVEKAARDIERGYFDSLKDYSDSERKRLKEELEKDGYTFVYNSDGSATLSNDEGEWFVGKGWVKNDYTEGLPEVTDGVVTMSAEQSDEKGNFYIFLIRNSTASYASDYVKALIDLGFEPEGNYDNVPEAGIISFAGQNKAGKRVEVGYSSYGFTIKIYK